MIEYWEDFKVEKKKLKKNEDNDLFVENVQEQLLDFNHFIIWLQRKYPKDFLAIYVSKHVIRCNDCSGTCMYKLSLLNVHGKISKDRVYRHYKSYHKGVFDFVQYVFILYYFYFCFTLILSLFYYYFILIFVFVLT